MKLPFKLLITFALIYCACQTAAADEKSAETSNKPSTDIIEVVMTSPDSGRLIEFNKATPESVRAEMLSAGLQTSLQNKCVEEELSIQELEFNLELDILIKNLAEKKVPVLDTDNKELLARVPLCPRFLVRLKVIALQMQNHKLVSITRGKEKIAFK